MEVILPLTEPVPSCTPSIHISKFVPSYLPVTICHTSSVTSVADIQLASALVVTRIVAPHWTSPVQVSFGLLADQINNLYGSIAGLLLRIVGSEFWLPVSKFLIHACIVISPVMSSELASGISKPLAPPKFIASPICPVAP